LPTVWKWKACSPGGNPLSESLSRTPAGVCVSETVSPKRRRLAKARGTRLGNPKLAEARRQAARPFVANAQRGCMRRQSSSLGPASTQSDAPACPVRAALRHCQMRTPFILVIHPSVPAKTLPEFIAYAKANPARISYGSAGPGSAAPLPTVATKRTLSPSSQISFSVWL
jgi:Tripartite tricarboxylate transporter family receptor